MRTPERNWVLIALVLFSLYLASAFLANVAGLYREESGNVAVIPVKGVITADGLSSPFGGGGVSSSEVVELLEKAGRNPSVKAVILEINSPGGSAVASEEIARAVKRLNKTSVAWIREVGASGAYWVASAADHVVASRASATGSIGVLASYLEFSGLLKRYNVTYNRLVAGKYKDMGSPYKELTPEEKAIIEKKLEAIHEYFVESVAANRNLSVEKVREFANGMVYLGEEAKELGLVDELGGFEEAKAYLEEELNITVKTFKLERKKNIFERLAVRAPLLDSRFLVRT